MALTSKQRAALRGQAQHIDTIFQIGKGGVTEETCVQITNALLARELIKLKVLDTCPHTAKQAAEILCKSTGSESVQIIGSKFVLFLQKQKDSKYEI